LSADQFLDLVFYFKLEHTHDAPQQNQLTEAVAGPLKSVEKPKMMTEAASKIAVPAWWEGDVTLSKATMIADQMRRKS